ncbi:MAG: hypothetical protein LE178_01245 [Endomicrobium sp.]|nr:hypothetical protein [Endomicrobium sp.]
MIHYSVCIILAIAVLALTAWVFVLYFKLQSSRSKILRLSNKVQGAPDSNNLLSLLISVDEFSLNTKSVANKDEFLDSVVKGACKLVKASSVTLMLTGSENDDLHIVSSKSSPEDLKASIGNLWGKSPRCMNLFKGQGRSLI